MSNNCLECAKQGRDCCREAHAKFLTLKDALRIAGFLGKPVNSFALYGGLKDEDREEYIYINKHQSYYYDLTLRDDRLLQLKFKDDGSCMFQSQDGRCEIYPVRPLICRTYPFWLSDDGEILFDGCSSDCPIVCTVTGNDAPEDVTKLEDPTGQARASEGFFSIIIPHENESDLIDEAKKIGLKCFRRVWVRPHLKKGFHRSILEFSFNKTEASQHEVCIRNHQTRQYSDEYKALTKAFYL